MGFKADCLLLGVWQSCFILAACIISERICLCLPATATTTNTAASAAAAAAAARMPYKD